LRPYRVDPALAQELFAEITRRYSEPGRFYHTLTHIGHVLQTIETLDHYLENSGPVRLAAWYHDAIYDTHAGDNEEKSAGVAESHLNKLKVPAGVVAETARLILMTKRHQAPPDDRAAQVFLDADLAILGAPPAQYREYAAAIRQEYGWVEETVYRTKRRKVLESFLERPHLFVTTELFERLETMARLNIAAEIETLAL